MSTPNNLNFGPALKIGAPNNCCLAEIFPPFFPTALQIAGTFWVLTSGAKGRNFPDFFNRFALRAHVFMLVFPAFFWFFTRPAAQVKQNVTCDFWVTDLNGPDGGGLDNLLVRPVVPPPFMLP